MSLEFRNETQTSKESQIHFDVCIHRDEKTHLAEHGKRQILLLFFQIQLLWVRSLGEKQKQTKILRTL